jgi:hypothetical protein
MRMMGLLNGDRVKTRGDVFEQFEWHLNVKSELIQCAFDAAL